MGALPGVFACMFPPVVAALIVLLVFVALALGVLAVAFSGNRSERPGERRRPSRANRRVTALAVVAVVVGVGLAVPVAIAVTNGKDHAKKGPGGVDLTASAERGRNLFAGNCSTCHTLRAANAVGRVGPNLDQLRPPKALVLNAIAKGRAQGRGQMPAQVVTGQDAEDVAKFVTAVAGR
jgi:mono/diheme cytochrome c family protein